MKSKGLDRPLLGLTQQDVAFLLKISRSQWSLYELSMRNLPSQASLRLMELTQYMRTTEDQTVPNISETENEENKMKLILEKLLKDNEFQLMVIARKIEPVQKKFDDCVKAVRLMGFLNSPAEIEKTDPEALRVIGSRVYVNFKDFKHQLDVLQLDKELLQQEQLVFKRALAKLS
jgi:transcriptional regulator with XRE-family HTH domain